MAGSMKVDGKLWTAASWLFRWVVSSVADNAGLDPDGQATLREIVDENLGWLSIDDLEPARRSIVRDWISERLVADADARLPVDLEADRGATLTHLGELARMTLPIRDADGE
ncbi:hypothetical protein [Kribbella sp. NBC_00889]|uniref:hypothetical protein n=1 Tax=Kribbella sp. NBC_00889 TaxID=2975974 RepID=UPI00386CEEAF|nr:hypothetical protein OG817_01080 [Kribbella sp. NBC_00889]